MASFCLQCAEALGFETDLAGIVDKDRHAQGYVVVVPCEDCGYTLVDHDGRCLTRCLAGHRMDGPDTATPTLERFEALGLRVMKRPSG